MDDIELIKPTAELVQITPEAERLIEDAMRTCYNSHDKCDGTIECSRKIIKKAIKMWHLDVIEAAQATFKIKCSRAAMAQITRHRLASFQVESQRYVEYDKPKFVVPPHYETGEKYFTEMMKIALESYKTLRDSYGYKKEDARLVLPEAWATTLYATMNLRSFRHFIELRSDRSAQWEIRDISNQILESLYKEAPSCFEDLYDKYLGGENDK